MGKQSQSKAVKRSISRGRKRSQNSIKATVERKLMRIGKSSGDKGLEVWYHNAVKSGKMRAGGMFSPTPSVTIYGLSLKRIIDRFSNKRTPKGN